jgi:HD-like signal output (HDOD) protein
MARAEGIPLHEAESKTLALTHMDAGQIIGRSWRLPNEVVETIAHHHAPGQAPRNGPLASIVCVSDLLCRVNGMGHGYPEERITNFAEEPAFAVLAKQFSALHPFDLARFTFEIEGMLEDVRGVVNRVYGAVQ